jgi:uracil-DNA glycosylase family 4
MISVKDSFANCLPCELLDAPSCILETNCKDDLSQVEVVFIAENPGKDEVNGKPPKPLIGKAGQTFRKFFRKYKLNSMKYLITNTVLCLTLDEKGNTGNPSDEVIERCKTNCFNIIRACNPKLIVLMGTSPMKAFGIAKKGITNIHGQLFKWENYDVFLTVHPSFVNRNPNVWEPKFEEDMAAVAGILRGETIKVKQKSGIKKLNKKGIHRYRIPDKFYTDDYRLIDIQFLMSQKKVLYIFRDKNNKKIYHKESDNYVAYQIPDGVPAKKIVPYDQLDQVTIPYMEKSKLDPEITYEGDMRITIKHAIDYYHNSHGEAQRSLSNIFFFDIEVDTGDEQVFPRPEQALFPINLISVVYNDKRICFIVDNHTEPITPKPGFELRIFETEVELMKEFIKFFKECDPDFIAGWNAINFDLMYIYTRLPQIKIPQTSMSLFNEFYVDGPKYVCHIPGCTAVDQDFLYRTFTFTKMENYKLAFIADHELGETKIQLPLPFNQMYWKMLNKTIEYNIRDTVLLEKLENKLKHINLMNELRTVCTTSFEGTSSFGQIDSLMVNYLKNKGLGSKNADPHITKEHYPGAYVYEPIPGIYNNVVDFDFASLYPSIIITYNIGPNNFVMKTKDPDFGYELAYAPDKLPDEIDMIIDPGYKKKEVKCKREDLLKKIKDDNLIHTINGCFFRPHNKEMSVFSEVLDMLLSSRKVYKGHMFDAIQAKDDDQEFYYFTRQLVYKVLANTLYGVVANKAFRFFDTSLAAAVTVSGQEALKASIIEGDAMMYHLDKGKDYVKPAILTKEEMFAEPSTPIYMLPGRRHDYIVTGDTDSIFCCFERFKGDLTVKKIHDYCETIQNFLNDHIMKDVVISHNVNPEVNRLVLKNELVISRGLFLAKKRYAIRVINNEGKDVDKINYMGVEIKRSDYPSKSKEFLSDLVELVLKSEKVSLSKIMSFVKRKEQEFIDLIRNGDKSISRPVSFGKPLKSYKVIPQGVRGMIAWNKIVYDIHKPGSKAYLYRIQGIDTMKAPPEILARYEKYIADGNKLDVIAIPDEEERLPEFIIPNLKENLKFCFEDRYELMLKPLFDAKKQMEVLTI